MKLTFPGTIILIGYGSIGRGLLPLLEAHLDFKPESLTVIDPHFAQRTPPPELAHYQTAPIALTPENYVRELDTYAIASSDTPTLIINVSVDVSSVAIIEYALERGFLYIDTATEVWPKEAEKEGATPIERTNYSIREQVRSLRDAHPAPTTVVSCCGANPGMVSWLVKAAALNIANDLGYSIPIPETQAQWSKLLMDIGVTGIHIAERDTQTTRLTRKPHQFMNTWSAPGCMVECLQPAELGWGTHERNPEHAIINHFTTGHKSSVYLHSRGGETVVQSWVPTGPQQAFLITHNESISLAEYFTVRDTNDSVIYRPTVHYAYRPSSVAIESIHELMELNTDMDSYVLNEQEIVTGEDILGVLLYGHEKNAYWYGSVLSIDETRLLTRNQNATGLQVSSALLAGILWAINNPRRGVIEAEEMDYDFCLSVQTPYLGTVRGIYTDWQPKQNSDIVEAWRFAHVLLPQRKLNDI